MNTMTSEHIQQPSTPPLRAKPSARQLESPHGSVRVPDRASSLRAPSTHHIASQTVQPLGDQATNLIHGYMVCGLSREANDWTFPSQSSSTRTSRAQGGIGSLISPSILGSVPPHDRDADTAQMFSSAMKAAFPNEAEIVSGSKAPDSTCHAFVLQSQPSQSLYGVALRLWVKIDARRRARILQVLAPRAAGFVSSDTTTWMPYCLTYISHYPLFDLMSDYLRCTWMLYGKDPDKFNSEGVLRIMQVPPPQPAQFLRIDLDKYTFCYMLPTEPSRFQNFALWPIFCCLAPQQIIAILESALSPEGRIIFTSQHPAVLTIVAETVRFYVKDWIGLYVPIVYSKEAQQLIDEPAPYILGVTKQSRSLFTAPRDALLIDLDFQRIFTTKPPGSLSHRQRKRYAIRLSSALGFVKTEGVPLYLRSAYDQDSQFNATGAIITSEKAMPSVKDPTWWDPVQTEVVLAHISKRIRQNYKVLAALGGAKQRPTTKIHTRDLAEMVHTQAFLSRSVDDAWQAYIKFKGRSDAKIVDLLKRESSLEADLQTQRQEYVDLSECTEEIIEETRQLQSKVNQHMRDNIGLSSQLRDKSIHAKQLSNHVIELQSELKEANKTLTVQQELLDEIEKSRKSDRASSTGLEGQCLLLTQERDEAHRAVIHLTSLISSQITYIERVISSLVTQPTRSSSTQDTRKSVRRSFQSLAINSPGLSPILSQFPLLKPEHETMGDPRRYSADASEGMSNSLSAAIATQATPGRSGTPPPQQDLAEDELSMREKVGAVSATVRKINEQCRAAIQDLADKRTEIHARAYPSITVPRSPPRKPSTGSLRSSSAPPAVVPSAIARLIESSRRNVKEGDNSSLASSQISKATQLTDASSVASSVPGMIPTTPTGHGDARGEPVDGSTRDASESKSVVKIQPIAEEDPEDPEDDHFVDAEPQPTKSHLREDSGVLGRNIFT